MELLFKMAVRNVWRHRGQSFVIGAILFLGALLMTVGNGVVSGMDQGLQKTIVRGFTGDLLLLADKQISDNVFMEMMARAVEPIYGYPALKAALKANPLVAGELAIGKNTVMILNEDEGASVFLYLLGVDFQAYREFFPDNIDVIEGARPAPGRRGLLLPAGARKDILNQTNIWFLPKGAGLDRSHLEGEAKDHPGDLSLKSNLVFMGFNGENSATDIRLDLDGVFRYKALNTIFGAYAITDIESYRQCLGYFQAAERDTGLSAKADSALFTLDESAMDGLFANGDGVAPAPAARSGSVDWSRKAATAPQAADVEAGAYNLVLVKLKPGTDADKALVSLNAYLKERKLGVRAVPWKAALGPVGSMATLIKAALFLFVSFLFVVALIVIVNTLTMAALERTPELGMMRAIGARKGFISLMFLGETAVLSCLFGGAGILVGAVTVEILASLKLASDNDMLQLFFGGDTFRPLLTPADFALAVAQLALVALAAVLYPILMARGITPLHATYKE